MNPTRTQILETTCELIEHQGCNGTGLNQIIHESGAPKGSLYHYFPEGKDAIVAEAVNYAGQRLAEHIREQLTQTNDATRAIRAFIESIADGVEKSKFKEGGPLTIVAGETATTNVRINQACQEAYERVRQAFAEKLVANGKSKAKAEQLALFIVSGIEGGTMLSRTFHTGDPLRLVAKQIAILLQD